MFELDLPKYTFKLKKETDKLFLFDEFRMKYVRATSEELVRQRMCWYLCKEKGFPKTLIVNEGVVKVNGMNKRYDTVIFSQHQEALMIIELKSPEIILSYEVLQQVWLYNQTIKVPFMLISNGLQHFCCRWDTHLNKWIELDYIPNYDEVK